jgi:hypothetical protein
MQDSTPEINPVPPSIVAAWHARADELARWAWERYVNRTDAYVVYRPQEEIGRTFTRPDGSTGTLGEQRTVHTPLTVARLARHFRATGRSDILVLHTADANNLSKGGGLDIDHHGPTSPPPAVNLQAALHWYRKLVERGFRPLLTDSNNAGGFHQRILLAEPIPADRLFHFLRELTRDHRQLGLGKAPEQFPKQPDVRRCSKGFGNGLRVPGRHHKRDFWSRIWNGSVWLEGEGAVNFLLALRGDRPGSRAGSSGSAPTATPQHTSPGQAFRRRAAGQPGGPHRCLPAAAAASRGG